MADFVVNSTAGQSMDSLWPASDGTNVLSVLSDSFSTTEYTIQLTSGEIIRYTGSFSLGLNGGFMRPVSGSYDRIELLGPSDTVLASLSGFGSADAADIFASPAAVVLSGDDTLSGGAGADTLRGFGGNDTFIIHAGELAAAEIILGGEGSDILQVTGSGSGPVDIVSNGNISSVESIVFATGTGSSAAAFSFTLNWAELPAWSSTLTVMARATSDSRDSIVFEAAGAASLDLNWLQTPGFSGNDQILIRGSAAGETVTGSFGADTFAGNGGADSFNAGQGDDVFVIGAAGFAGSTFNGGIGFDRLRVTGTTPVIFGDITLSSVDGIELDSGSNFRLNAAELGLFINPQVTALGTGQTEIFRVLMAGATTLNLNQVTFQNWESRDAVMIAGTGQAETIGGSNVADRINGNGGADSISGNGGNDVIQFIAGSNPVTVQGSIDGGSGADMVDFRSAAGLSGAFTLDLRAASVLNMDIINFQAGGSGNIFITSLQFATGFSAATQLRSLTTTTDVLNLDISTAYRSADLRQLDVTRFGANSNNLTEDYIVITGTSGADTVWGSAAKELFHAKGGADTVRLGGGVDAFYMGSDHFAGVAAGLYDGGTGADSLVVTLAAAQPGFDLRAASFSSIEYLFGFGAGTLYMTAQQLTGQFGALYTGAAIAYDITMGSATSFTLARGVMSGPTNGIAPNFSVHGDADNETIAGCQVSEIIDGGDGLDTIIGSAGADRLSGGLAFDTLSYANSSAAVTVDLAARTASGGDAQGDIIAGFERVTGSSLADTLTGSKGVNILTGGLGADTLTGGLGRDSFDYNAVSDSGSGAAADSITDFTVVTDPLQPLLFADRIDLSTIDASASTAGNNAFTFIGTAGFSAEGQVRATTAGSDTLIEVNTTGTGPAAEMTILLTGFSAANIAAVDFIL